MGKYINSKVKIESLDQLMRQKVVFFLGEKVINKEFFQNWQMRIALYYIQKGLLTIALKRGE